MKIHFVHRDALCFHKTDAISKTPKYLLFILRRGSLFNEAIENELSLNNIREGFMVIWDQFVRVFEKYANFVRSILQSNCRDLAQENTIEKQVACVLQIQKVQENLEQKEFLLSFYCKK